MHQDFIRIAIIEKRLLQFQYEASIRVTEPHTIGYDIEGVLTLCAWELSGGEGPGWRQYQVAKLSGPTIVKGDSQAPRHKYDMQKASLDRIMWQI